MLKKCCLLRSDLIYFMLICLTVCYLFDCLSLLIIIFDSWFDVFNIVIGLIVPTIAVDWAILLLALLLVCVSVTLLDYIYTHHFLIRPLSFYLPLISAYIYYITLSLLSPALLTCLLLLNEDTLCLFIYWLTKWSYYLHFPWIPHKLFTLSMVLYMLVDIVNYLLLLPIFHTVSHYYLWALTSHHPDHFSTIYPFIRKLWAWHFLAFVSAFIRLIFWL